MSYYIKIKQLHKYILFINILFIISCNNEAKKTKNIELFDIKKTIIEDIHYLTQNNCNEIKITKILDKSDTQFIKNIDWDKELEILKSCTIYKENWKDKFILEIKNDYQELHYTSNSKNIPIKKMIVYCQYKSGIVEKIEIDKEIKSLFFSTQSHIIYYPKIGFQINGTNKTINSKQPFFIDIKFDCKK